MIDAIDISSLMIIAIIRCYAIFCLRCLTLFFRCHAIRLLLLCCCYFICTRIARAECGAAEHIHDALLRVMRICALILPPCAAPLCALRDGAICYADICRAHARILLAILRCLRAMREAEMTLLL